MRCAPDILGELLVSQFVNVVESYSMMFIHSNLFSRYKFLLRLKRFTKRGVVGGTSKPLTDGIV